MKLRDLMLIMFIITLIAASIFWFQMEEARTEFKPVTLPSIGSFVLENVIYGQPEDPMKNPIDLAIGSDGRIYVTDSEHHRVKVFDSQGEFLFQFGKQGEKEGEFNYPVGIVIDSKQRLYIVDLLNKRISVYDSNGKFLNNLTGMGSHNAVKSPTAVTIDINDQLYLIDKSDNKVKKLSSDGKLLMSFGGLGEKEGLLRYPLGLAVSEKGDILVGDTGNSRVQVFTAEGKFKLAFTGKFNTPSGIAIDQKNRIFITDPFNSKVVISTYWGEKENSLGNIGVTTDKLYFPEGIEIKSDRLYIADKGNNRIVIYQMLNKK